MGTGRYSSIKKAHNCAFLVHYLADIILPQCPLASNQHVKHSRKKWRGIAVISGIHIVADDIIIVTKMNQEHDHILTQVLESAKDCNIVFNLHKLQLQVNEVKYPGTTVTPEGTKSDPSEVKAIIEMTPPTDKAGIRRLLGMINFFAAHIPNMSSITAPFWYLLKSNVISRTIHSTDKSEENSFIFTHFTLLQPTLVSTIQADANLFGLAARGTSPLLMPLEVCHQQNATVHKLKKNC